MQPSPQRHSQFQSLNDLIPNAELEVFFCEGNSGRVTSAQSLIRAVPLATPPRLAAHLAGPASSLVLQLGLPRSATRKLEDLPWSEGYAYQATPGQALEFKVQVYNFSPNAVAGRLQIIPQPADW